MYYLYSGCSITLVLAVPEASFVDITSHGIHHQAIFDKTYLPYFLIGNLNVNKYSWESYELVVLIPSPLQGKSKSKLKPDGLVITADPSPKVFVPKILTLVYFMFKPLLFEVST